MSDSRPPNSENRNADTLPISSEEMATRVTTMANASLALSRVSANSVTTFASPNLTPGTGTMASSGNMRSTSESTTATAASMPQSVNRFAFFMCCTPYDTTASMPLSFTPTSLSTTRCGRQTAACPAWVSIPVRTHT